MQTGLSQLEENGEGGGGFRLMSADEYTCAYAAKRPKVSGGRHLKFYGAFLIVPWDGYTRRYVKEKGIDVYIVSTERSKKCEGVVLVKHWSPPFPGNGAHF